MEMERVTEFPMGQLDLRPRKRQRLGWDVVPTPPKAQLGLFCGQEIGNVASFASPRAPSDHISSPLVKRVARNASPPWRQDDKDGHYVFAIGDNLTSRYKIHGKMGEGTFGQVLECWDKERKEMVAIKIVRGIKKYREAAMIEIDVLQQLVMHDLRLIHTDLKPENILLVSPEYVKVPDYKGSSRSPKDSSFSKRVPKSSAIKVIDFGSTTYDRQDQSYIVSTRHYRAPEVILGLGWSYPCDIWSVGCILVELCSGEALFQTHENLEHLAMMERVLGPLPTHMLKKADRHADKYVRKGRLDWPEGAASRESIKAVMKLPRLQTYNDKGDLRCETNVVHLSLSTSAMFHELPHCHIDHLRFLYRQRRRRCLKFSAMDTATLAMACCNNTVVNPNPTSRIPLPSFTFFKNVQFGLNSSSPMIHITGNPRSMLACSAVTITPSLTSDHHSSAISKLQSLASEFKSISEPIDRVKRLLQYANLLPQFDDSLKIPVKRVMGCTAQVWLDVRMDADGKMRFLADSDSEITKGFCSCLISVLDGATPEEVLGLKTEDLGDLNVAGLHGGKVDSRANTWHNVLISMQKKTKALVAEREGKSVGEPFPSMVITAEGIGAKGSFAEAQARFLFPDEAKVEELSNLLKEKQIGVVAHFYMDPEVQGVLTSAQKHWPHIYISDSLLMADSAVTMAKAGCKFIAVLGVDFMSENVRAILDQAGFPEVGVYRMSDEEIGCSLADAASSPAYMDYLSKASSTISPSLHVVYINTSLETKAHAHELVPTITCTSSNVVQTILQAFAEVPNLNVWYGPDTYMGANIVELFKQMTLMTDDEISKIHPEHSRNSIKSLLPRLHYFQDGTCIVHHLFGYEVVERINDMYSDAFLTAHFEVPGEMFSLAMEAKRRGMGVVGSTQNILDFIKSRVQEALDRNVDDHLQFVLGTESGMVTSIVAAVRKLLGTPESGKVSVEIVFPVSSDSVTTSNSSELGKNVSVLPGVTSGEGCSLHGGCASCPYMKMNSLTSLVKVCNELPHGKDGLTRYEAGRFSMLTPKGKLIADVGCQPILHMRHYQMGRVVNKQVFYVTDQICPSVTDRQVNKDVKELDPESCYIANNLGSEDT
ncbi:hypothetical protein LXL04_009481 [Taraxacum kok-saghyz]